MNLEEIKIVVADQSGYMRRIIRTMVRSFGVNEIIEAEDGALALEAIEANSPDILITELKMPIFDGLELSQMIRGSSANYATMPIIAVSADSRKRRIEEARDIGITEFLIKPISTKSLYFRLQNVIDNPRPFVVAESYIGPDRRRTVNGHYQGVDRRQDDQFAIDAAF